MCYNICIILKKCKKQTKKNKKELRTNIEVLKGENTLSIVAVDSDGNSTSRTEKIKGANKPTFTVSSDGNNLIINAKDEEGISKIEITVDGVTTDTGDNPINKTEVDATIAITPGEHTVTVVVTNINGLKEEQSFTATL